jgi:hypothetical protein
MCQSKNRRDGKKLTTHSLGITQSTFALNLFSRNYKFNVSRNSKGYCYTEESRCECGIVTTKNSEVTTNKVDIIDSIDFNKISKQHEINNVKEYNFLLNDVKQLPLLNNKLRVFFYDTLREIIWEKLKHDIIIGIYDNYINLLDYSFFKVIDEVSFMDIDLVGKTVTFSEITYKEGNFTDTIIVDFNLISEYLDINKLIENIKVILPDKEHMSIQIILHTNATSEFDTSRKCYLFDQPLFASCFSIAEDEGRNDFITMTRLFNNNLWEGNFANFIKIS